MSMDNYTDAVLRTDRDQLQSLKMQKRLALIFFVLFISMLISTDKVWAQKADDQTILPGDRKAIVNPVPVARDFVGNNKKHQIIMAVIDTGVDYNHPLLMQNMHFKLDAKGQPTGLGWDFVGNDAWPSPLSALSADLIPNAPAEDVAAEKRMSDLMSDFLTINPSMKKYFDVHRSFADELGEGLFHGTHVAGLMVYDEPRLGLMVYRALPARITYAASGRMAVQDPSGDLIKAAQQAIADGARVINMSLGLSVTKDMAQVDPEGYQATLKLMQDFKALAIANPQVAFVAATGNDGTWIDDRARLDVPCGVDAKNILCVGALAKDGYIASFSNIILPDYPFLLAPGDEILSTFPSEFCDLDPRLVGFLPSRQASDMLKNPEQKQYLYSQITQTCQNQNGFFPSSGTSMATPIASRALGKVLLENPKLSGAEAVQKLMASTVDLMVGKMVMKKLIVEKPSWYPDKAVSPKFMDVVSGQAKKQKQYFEFYSKSPVKK